MSIPLNIQGCISITLIVLKSIDSVYKIILYTNPIKSLEISHIIHYIQSKRSHFIIWTSNYVIFNNLESKTDRYQKDKDNQLH